MIKPNPIIDPKAMSTSLQILCVEIYKKQGLSSEEASAIIPDLALVVEEGVKNNILSEGLIYGTEKRHYDLNPYAPDTRKLLDAYDGISESWPDPFYKGYPKDKENRGFHIISETGEGIDFFEWKNTGVDKWCYESLFNGSVYTPRSMDDSFKYVSKVTIDDISKLYRYTSSK